MKTSASLLSLALFFALPAAAQMGSSSGGGHGSSGGHASGASHASGGSGSHGSSGGHSSFASSHSSGSSSFHSAASYSSGSGGHFVPARPESVAQAAGRYIGSHPAAPAAPVMQRGFARAPFVGSLVSHVQGPLVRMAVQPKIVVRGPFIIAVPRQQFGTGFFVGFHHGFHHGFGNSFCGPSFGFGFGGFNSFNCFGGFGYYPYLYPIGLGYGGFSYGPGYYDSGYEAAPAPPVNTYEPPSAPGTYTPNALTPAAPEESAAPETITLLQLKDGAMYGVTAYWLDHGQLHYVASYGGENTVPLDRVDIEKTVELNSANGVAFVLRNAPAPQPRLAPILLPLQPSPYPELIF